MPAPNDVEIVRVYTRNLTDPTADVQFRSDENYEVVVECEAGTAIAGSGLPFHIGVTVRNLTDSNIPEHNDTISGTVVAPDWPGSTLEVVFPDGGGGYTPDPGVGQIGVHLYETVAWLKVRATDPDVSFARSPIFLVYHHGP